MRALYLLRAGSYQKILNYKNDQLEILHILLINRFLIAPPTFEICALKDPDVSDGALNEEARINLRSKATKKLSITKMKG